MGVYEVSDAGGAFGRWVAGFGAVVAELADPLVDVVTHAELEDWLSVQGRELMRSLFQDQLDLRALREARRADVVAVGKDGRAAGWSRVTIGR